MFKWMSEGIPLCITNSANLVNCSLFTLPCSSSGQSRQLPWWQPVSPCLCWEAVTCLLWTTESSHLPTCTGEGSECLVSGFLPVAMISASELSAPLKKGIFPSIVQLCFFPKPERNRKMNGVSKEKGEVAGRESCCF